jgi:hypothetical protein
MPEWVVKWLRESGGHLEPEQIEFLEDLDRYGGPSNSLWTERPGRRFERFALEGPADGPWVACYFRDDLKRPGLLVAFEWALLSPGPDWRDGLGFSVWDANLTETLNAETSPSLPTEPGPDGVARIR